MSLQFYEIFVFADLLSNAVSYLPNLAAAAAEDSSKYVFGIDMSIEGLRAKQYSYYIFVFLVLSVILFTYIIYLYLPKGGKTLKTGEKIMFGALILGVVVAIVIGWIQLIEGYLL